MLKSLDLKLFKAVRYLEFCQLRVFFLLFHAGLNLPNIMYIDTSHHTIKPLKVSEFSDFDAHHYELEYHHDTIIIHIYFVSSLDCV